MPMPPSQCVIERQNSSARGSASTSERIEAPVVVKPDMTSKNASTKRGIHPLRMNGSVARAEAATHASATRR